MAKTNKTKNCTCVAEIEKLLDRCMERYAYHIAWICIMADSVDVDRLPLLMETYKAKFIDTLSVKK
ncbi:MAG: hypothetical protein FWC80_00860 [Firmicutes bacterium]|nr:hypothetical protein [Bacillota bacterium]